MTNDARWKLVPVSMLEKLEYYGGRELELTSYYEEWCGLLNQIRDLLAAPSQETPETDKNSETLAELLYSHSHFHALDATPTAELMKSGATQIRVLSAENERLRALFNAAFDALPHSNRSKP